MENCPLPDDNVNSSVELLNSRPCRSGSKPGSAVTRLRRASRIRTRNGSRPRTSLVSARQNRIRSRRIIPRACHGVLPSRQFVSSKKMSNGASRIVNRLAKASRCARLAAPAPRRYLSSAPQRQWSTPLAKVIADAINVSSPFRSA